MKPVPAVMASLLVAMTLAGCTQEPEAPPTSSGPQPFHPSVLSQSRFDILAPESLAVAATDGKLLENAVYRPDTDEKVPVFINFSPYWGDTAMHGGDNFANYLVQEYVPRGYAVVLSSVRGTGHSEGCFQIGGDVELQDAHDVIGFFAAQPWSNGNVAAGGKSYDSTTQNGVVAKFPHPALKGVFHVSGITDMYRYNAKDGVVYNNGLQFTPRYYVTQGLDEYLGATNGAGSPEDESPGSLARLADDLACPEFATHLVSGEGTAGHGMRDAYWVERDWNRYLPESTWNGSVFFVHGLQDWNVKPDHIDPWVDILQQKGIPVLGWLHQETQGLGHVYPMRADWNETMLRWLDFTLKGVDTRMDELWGFESQGTDKVWRRSSTWPPPSTGDLVLEQAVPDPRPPGAALRVAGVPYAEVTVIPSGSDDIARVILFENIGGTQTYVTEAVRRLALSDDLETPRTVTPGVAIQLNLTFFPIDHVKTEGSTWAVQLGDMAVATPTPADFFFRPDQVRGVSYPSIRLHLPLADAAENVPQPEGTPCFTC